MRFKRKDGVKLYRMIKTFTGVNGQTFIYGKSDDGIQITLPRNQCEFIEDHP